MTNDDAIYVLKNTAWLGWDKQKEKVTEAVRMAIEALKRETSGDAIDRQAAIRIASGYCHPTNIAKELAKLPSVQPETCEGCKHLDKWENEVEYGYPSPCTRCKRRVEDHYER